MKLFDVYPLFNIELNFAQGSYVWDTNGTKYMDLYGGHAVISIGHSHPHYIQKITAQLHKIGFYSNSIQISQQKELAQKLGELSGYPDYELFLISSGAEANENALKLASFHTGRKKVLAFSKAFHGRTSLAVAATDDKKIVAPMNETDNVYFLPFNDEAALDAFFAAHGDELACAIIEGIQGVGGVQVPTHSFWKKLAALCQQHGALLIADEVQSGYGRSGKFFAHQHAGVQADIITVAKGMGNGFPVGGVLIHPDIPAKHGMLGTTFGGNHLACAAAIAVLDVIKSENLMENATEMGNYLMEKLKHIQGIKEVRGVGLMIGIELHEPCADVRNTLLKECKMFTGAASNKNTIRILPALNIKKYELDAFLKAFGTIMEKKMQVV
jgi:acetylornithine/N-succinyldiaminopimelate aminotransferase